MNMMAGLCIYCGYRVVARSVRCFAGTYLSPCSRGSSALRTALENPQALRWRDGAMARRRAVVPPASPPMPRRRIAWDQEVAPLRWRPSWAMRRPGGGGGTDGSPATVARRPTLLSLSSLTGLLHAAGVGDEGLLVDLEAWRLQWVHASKAMACSVQRPLVGGAGMGAAAFAALGERQVTIVGFAGISLEAYALCLGSQLAGNTGVALSVKMVHLSDVPCRGCCETSPTPLSGALVSWLRWQSAAVSIPSRRLPGHRWGAVRCSYSPHRLRIPHFYTRARCPLFAFTALPFCTSPC